MKRIAVIGLGGTIAMTASAAGFVPTRSIADLIAAVPALAGLATYETLDFLSVASANIGFNDLVRLAATIETMATGCEGVVVVQGTDTIDETAFALELLVSRSLPVIVTGAMRAASLPSPDGPGNLVAAVRTASDPGAVGVHVVMNDEVHAARYVVKSHTSSVAAFQSPDAGMSGRLHEGRVRWVRSSLPQLGVLKLTERDDWPQVALLPLGLGDDGRMLRSVADLGFSACVLQAMGGGHVAEALVPDIAQLAAQMPVVLCARSAAGPVYEASYGYRGAEIDLLANGVISGGALTSYKTRILLTLLIAADFDSAPKEFSRIRALV